MEQNKILVRIKKLLAKAGSTDSPEEAESLFVKAQKLMVQNRISQSQLQDSAEEFIVEANQVYCFARKLEGEWERRLARALSRPNCCDFVISKWRNGPSEHNYITFYGHPQDVQLVKYFFETTRDTFRQLSKKEAKKNNEGNKNTYIRSFLLGACEGLSSKITKMTSDHLEETGNSLYPILVRDTLSKVYSFLKENVDFTSSKASPSKAGDLGAFMQGVLTGKSHSLRIPVETTSSGFKGNSLK